jgi:hypothetical protein
MEAIFNSNNDDDFYEHILSCQNSLFLSSTILLSFSSFAIFPIFMDRGPIGQAPQQGLSSAALAPWAPLIGSFLFPIH